MQGQAFWPQLVFIAGLISTAALAGFLIAWRFNVVRLQDRMDLKMLFEQRVSSIEQRVSAVELQNAGTLVVLKHVEEFRSEVKRQLDGLQKERREDMEGIRAQLSAIINEGRLNRIAMEDRDGHS